MSTRNTVVTERTYPAFGHLPFLLPSVAEAVIWAVRRCTAVGSDHWVTLEAPGLGLLRFSFRPNLYSITEYEAETGLYVGGHYEDIEEVLPIVGLAAAGHKIHRDEKLWQEASPC